ncbi:MAG: glycoside hydrolase family 15 protein [Sumerlaeia bacterium]
MPLPIQEDYQPIANYGVVGDLNTVALVGMDGSIDFMCFPRFDSPTIFASLLDRKKGGRFLVAPLLNDANHKQIYLPESNILLTRFLSHDGVGEVSDFMPITETCPKNDLVRRAKCVRGEIVFRMVFAPRFDYARADHEIRQISDSEFHFLSRGPDRTALRLRIFSGCEDGVPITLKEGAACAEFRLCAGENVAFVMEALGDECADSPSTSEDFVSSSFKQTVNYWRSWLSRMKYSGRWHDMMERSALTLKLLVSEPHGSIVAAPTFGLPEEIGGSRNWDYRYTWIRDASFTLYALIRLGYTKEAENFMGWMEARCRELADGRSLNIMYGIDGRHDLKEEDLSHLEGYRGSRPVRVGNGAYDQLQLDIYGELMDSVYMYDKFAEPISYDLWMNLRKLIDWVCENYDQPDEGIWEVRGGRQKFLFSRVMCWVAVDRGIRLALKRSLPAPMDRWMKARDRMYFDVFEKFWNPQVGAFMQFEGSDALDAASLLMPLIKFISPKDPRWLSHMKAVEKQLVDDSLVYRYHNLHSPDGLHGTEGTFSMCSFWFVECLSRAGDVEKARFYFEKMQGYANHLGLYAEELGRSGEHLGNFPQAFTHLGLISAAFDLDRRLGNKG